MNGPRLSERLTALAEAVPRGARLADIGTDHGPLERAAEHIREYGLADRAETRLSDGLQALTPGECDTVLIAGMGGELMTRILKEAFARKSGTGEDFPGTVKCWILSPHTEWDVLRRFLREAGLAVKEENMVLEDGKFYPVICASPGDPEEAYAATAAAGIPPRTAERFGPVLTFRRHPAVLRCMERELEKDRKLLSQLREKENRQELSVSGMERIAELENEIRDLKTALDI